MSCPDEITNTLCISWRVEVIRCIAALQTASADVCWSIAKAKLRDLLPLFICNRLVWFERFEHIDNAIDREKQIKRWRREKKVRLIEMTNPTWRDVSQAWEAVTADPSISLRFSRDDKP